MAMRLAGLRWVLGKAFWGAVLLVGVSWYFKGSLVPPHEIDPRLLEPPQQGATDRGSFDFEYKGQQCRVRPVADYEIHGLVVSHNNIESFADIYHDSTSVDTKDLCVLWGSNLRSEEFHQVRFSSGPFTCYFRYPAAVSFDHEELSNNHIITDDPAVRERIGEVKVGDQVRLEGFLADYQMDDWQSFWRETSTTRKDSDCEVMFVEEIEILRRGTPGWYASYRLGWIMLVAIPVLYVVVLWLESAPPAA